MTTIEDAMYGYQLLAISAKNSCLGEEKAMRILNEIYDNPSTPEIIKIWIKIGGYADMTLAEFIEKTSAK
jgi:hypothetical protein